MNRQIDDLIIRIRTLEEELEAELKARRDEFQFSIEKKRVRFAEEVAKQQRRFKTGLFDYLIHSRPLNLLTAPVIYLGFVPFLLLDLFLTLYQTICFPVYGIPRVNRSTYMVFDREDLPYLNVVEKFNCFYCSYGNGVASYFREIAARTEQYWCPIKHARRIFAAHSRYPHFFEFGDAESYLKGLERIRKEFKLDDETGKRG